MQYWQRKPDDEMGSMATKQAATPGDCQIRGSRIPIWSNTRSPHVGRENYYSETLLRAVTPPVGEVSPSVLVSFSPTWGIGSRPPQEYCDFPITGVDRIDRTSRLLTKLEQCHLYAWFSFPVTRPTRMQSLAIRPCGATQRARSLNQDKQERRPWVFGYAV